MSDRSIWEILAIFMVLVMVGSCAAMPSVGDVSESEVKSSSSATIYVPDDYLTIQEAVNAASPGNTIIVKDGTYTENVEVDKRLTIRSENGSDSTIVQARNWKNPAFRVTADNTEITGFTVKGAFSYALIGPPSAIFTRGGIQLESCEYCNISNNICYNNSIGIHLVESGNNIILKNNCSSNIGSGAIYLDSSNNNLITNNNCSNNNFTTSCFDVTTGRMEVVHWGNGISVRDSNNNIISVSYTHLTLPTN